RRHRDRARLALPRGRSPAGAQHGAAAGPAASGCRHPGRATGVLPAACVCLRQRLVRRRICAAGLLLSASGASASARAACNLGPGQLGPGQLDRLGQLDQPVIRACGLALCLAMAALPMVAPGALAQQVVVYRCTDGLGNVTVQNDEPCPKGAREQRKVIDTPPPLPVFEPPEAPEGPGLYAPPVRIVKRPGAVVPELEPPPALFQCTTWDQLHYFTEQAKPQQHCAPLQVVGIDGVSRPEASACEM